MFSISSGTHVFLLFFVMAGCNFVLADMHYTSKNVAEMFDLSMNVGSAHTRCLLEQKVEFFSSSDFYQVQDHGWVIWLHFYYRALFVLEMIGLLYSICGLEFTPFFCLIQLILLECLLRLIPWIQASPRIHSRAQEGDKLWDTLGEG